MDSAAVKPVYKKVYFKIYSKFVISLVIGPLSQKYMVRVRIIVRIRLCTIFYGSLKLVIVLRLRSFVSLA